VDDYRRVGSWVRRARLEHGDSQEALAERLGVSKQAVSLWETGRRLPGRDAYLQLARYAGINPHELAVALGLEEPAAAAPARLLLRLPPEWRALTTLEWVLLSALGQSALQRSPGERLEGYLVLDALARSLARETDADRRLVALAAHVALAQIVDLAGRPAEAQEWTDGGVRLAEALTGLPGMVLGLTCRALRAKALAVPAELALSAGEHEQADLYFRRALLELGLPEDATEQAPRTAERRGVVLLGAELLARRAYNEVLRGRYRSAMPLAGLADQLARIAGTSPPPPLVANVRVACLPDQVLALSWALQGPDTLSAAVHLIESIGRELRVPSTDIVVRASFEAHCAVILRTANPQATRRALREAAALLRGFPDESGPVRLLRRLLGSDFDLWRGSAATPHTEQPRPVLR